MTNYQHAKMALKTSADIAKEQYKTDKPAIRQVINDEVHFLSQDFKLNKHQRDLLAKYACALHP